MEKLILSTCSLEQFKLDMADEVAKKVTPIILAVLNQKETQFLNRRQAAEFLGVSVPTILEWTKSGKIIGYRISSRIRYKKAELENSIAKIKGGGL